MSDISEPPVPLPAAQVESIRDGISLLPPLSRRGRGPGLILILPDGHSGVNREALEKNGTPPPLSKWAEEGYVVVEILTSALQSAPSEALNTGFLSIQRQKDFTSDGGVGLICYDPAAWRHIAGLDPFDKFKACVLYSNLAEIEIPSLRPTLYHVHGKAAKGTREVKVYHYDSASSSLFAIPGQNHFDYRLESISHTRNLTFLKSHMQGPNFDLEAIWDEHTYYELENRSVAKTMGTMVQEPYVNHIPTLTGGIGRERLTNFYRYHFIWNNPEDIYNRLISRTIGIDRICDEFIMELTHKQTIDWLLPGIPPTGKELRIPFVAIVNIRGDRLYHEHIMWDQASALAQCGLLPEYLPFPYPVCDANQTTQNKLFEYHLPVAGVDTAVKMMDKHGTPSNSMIEYAVREVGSS
ncbi:LEA domain protein [Aspergillus minisclerotigenes]|uniref:LEA domain protein n=1 Tax=Aspergillus minisclerotigenes TaxID=656917 RepID=A0A5N6IQB3_9EURO|nr:LEA domain protein [Aspergillus minisclerotigenes]